MKRLLAIDLPNDEIRARLVAQLREVAERLTKRYERRVFTASVQPEVEARLKHMRGYDPDDCKCPYCWNKNDQQPIVISDGDEENEAFHCRACGQEWRVSI